jgi:hypothetical protein
MPAFVPSAHSTDPEEEYFTQTDAISGYPVGTEKLPKVMDAGLAIDATMQAPYTFPDLSVVICQLSNLVVVLTEDLPHCQNWAEAIGKKPEKENKNAVRIKMFVFFMIGLFIRGEEIIVCSF